MTLLPLIQQKCIQALQHLNINNVNQSNNLVVDITLATNSKFGHYQCNSAMKLSKILGKAPQAIAKELREEILQQDSAGIFAKIEIAGPGFINFTLSEKFLSDQVNQQL